MSGDGSKIRARTTAGLRTGPRVRAHGSARGPRQRPTSFQRYNYNPIGEEPGDAATPDEDVAEYETPYRDDASGEYEEDINPQSMMGPANSMYTVLAVLGMIVLGIGIGYGVWLDQLQGNVHTLQKVIIVNPNIPFLDVYINPLTGNDSTGTGSQSRPFATLGRALLRISECTGTRATIHIEGSTCGLAGALDLGTDMMYDFFPATAQYGEIVIRGSRQNTVSTTVQGVNALPGYQDYVQVVTAAGGLTPNTLRTHFVHNEDTNRVFVIEDNTVTAIDVVGGNVPDVSLTTGVMPPGAMAFETGNAIETYTVCNAITWSGILQLNHSYNRVAFEDLQIIPANNVSIWVNPPLRDDAVIFRGTHLFVKGTATIQFDSETGLPDFTDLNPTYRGSMALEGVYINGTGVTNAAFNSMRDNTCSRMDSVLIDSAYTSFNDACSAFFVSFNDVNSGDVMTVATGDFRGHGLKFRTPTLSATQVTRAIRATGGALISLTSVDVGGEYAIGFDADSSATGYIQRFKGDTSGSPYTYWPVMAFGEVSNFAVRELDLTGNRCMQLFGMCHVAMWQEFACTPTEGTAITLFNGASLDFDVQDQATLGGPAGPPPWSVINQTNAASIVEAYGGSTFHTRRTGTELAWTTPNGIPLVKLYTGSRFIGPKSPAITNGNPNNADYVLQVGSNNPTAYFTQDDYLSPTSDRCQALAADPSRTPEVWVDPLTGADSNPGGQSTPLASIGQAIAVLGQRSGTSLECIIHLVGTLDLGANPTICTTPLEKICKHVTFKGREFGAGATGAAVEDVVASIIDIDPTSRNWKQIIGLTGGYMPSAFDTYFVRNNAQDRVFVVESNDGTSVDTIAGTTLKAIAHTALPPVAVDQVAWKIGDDFTLFTISDTLTWTGTLLLDVPYNKISFESLIFAPTVTGSNAMLPDGADYGVVFRGCRLNALSDDLYEPSYMGSMLLLGCYVEGLVPTAYFTSNQAGRSFAMESVWVHQANTLTMGTAGIFFFKSSEAPTYALVTDGPTQATHLYFEETVGFLSFGLHNGASAAYVEYVKVVRHSGDPLHTCFNVITGSSTFSGNMEINCTTSSCIGINVQWQSVLTIHRPSLIIDAAIPIRVLDGSKMGIDGTTTTLSGMTGAAITVSTESLFRCSPGVFTVDMQSLTSPVADVTDGSRLALSGFATNYVWNTVANTPLVRVSDGSQAVQDTIGGDIVNGGINADHVLVCGNNVISPWDISEHDTTDNVECTNAGNPGTQPQLERVVYIDTDAGSNANRGLDPSEAVSTMTRAIEIMGQREAITCIIQIQGYAPLDLGMSPTLCTTPMERTCKHITIQGIRQNQVGDTVQSTATSGTVQWYTVTANTGGFTPNAYDRQYAYNINKNRYYVVETNDATTVSTVAGQALKSLSNVVPPDTGDSTLPWENGNSFRLFTLNTTITWQGVLTVDIPYNKLTFENLIFDPAVDESILSAPGGPEYQLLFRGCELRCYSGSGQSSRGSYQGSILVRGSVVTSQDIGNDIYAFGLQALGRCAQLESVWLDHVIAAFSGADCAAYSVKSVDCTGNAFYIVDGQVEVNRVQIVDPVNSAIYAESGSTVNAFRLDISGEPPFCIHLSRTSAFSLDRGTIALTSGTVYVAEYDSTITLYGSAHTYSGSGFAVVRYGSKLISRIPLTATATTQDTITIDSTSYAAIDATSTVTLTAGTGQSVIVCDGRLDMTGVAANAIWSTDSLAVIVMGKASTLRSALSGGALVNSGVGTAVLVCGPANPTTNAWASVAPALPDNAQCTI